MRPLLSLRIPENREEIFGSFSDKFDYFPPAVFVLDAQPHIAADSIKQSIARALSQNGSKKFVRYRVITAFLVEHRHHRLKLFNHLSKIFPS